MLTFTCVFLILPILNPGSFALAKRRSPPRAYSFIAEGGKASQGECDGERKIPRLKKLKEFSKAGSYMGSELQDPEILGKANEEMWKHFFRAKAACNTILAKTPSSVGSENLSKAKGELPPEDSIESEEEGPQQSETADSE